MTVGPGAVTASDDGPERPADVAAVSGDVPANEATAGDADTPAAADVTAFGLALVFGVLAGAALRRLFG